MSDLINSLDAALADTGEDFTLRRVTGTGASVTNADVLCRGRIDAMSIEEIAAGLKATDLNVIFSPTQINLAGWPGTASTGTAPFVVDARVPRENGADKAIIRGVLRQIALVKPFWINNELVRIEMRVSG